MMDTRRARQLAQRLRFALGRKPSKEGKLRLCIRREELQQLCELAEHYEYLYTRIGVGDVMRELNCNKDIVYRMVLLQKLPCMVLPSGHRRFLRKDVLALKHPADFVTFAQTMNL
jgi:hypothetical protein